MYSLKGDETLKQAMWLSDQGDFTGIERIITEAGRSQDKSQALALIRKGYNVPGFNLVEACANCGCDEQSIVKAVLSLRNAKSREVFKKYMLNLDEHLITVARKQGYEGLEKPLMAMNDYVVDRIFHNDLSNGVRNSTSMNGDGNAIVAGITSWQDVKDDNLLLLDLEAINRLNQNRVNEKKIFTDKNIRSIIKLFNSLIDLHQELSRQDREQKQEQMELEEEIQEYVSQNGETPEQTVKKLNKRFYKKDMEKYYSKYEEEVKTLKQNESEGENKRLLFNIATNKLKKDTMNSKKI